MPSPLSAAKRSTGAFFLSQFSFLIIKSNDVFKDFGWNDFHQHNYDQSHNHGELVGRVVSVQGFKHHLVTEKGELEAELAGRLLYGSEAEDLPKVGDWAAISTMVSRVIS
ncbi:MAG: hypothetical protein WDO15_26620 [Bacteroidota bacterium]